MHWASGVKSLTTGLKSVPGSPPLRRRSTLAMDVTRTKIKGTPGAPVVEVPSAPHHVMLDEPLAFISALRAMLERWTGAET